MIDIATDSTTVDANDMVTAKSVAEALHAHYPGHLWAITCEGKTGLLTIRNLFCAGNLGYIVKLPSVYSISDLIHQAKIGAGEILERFRLARGRFNETEYHALPTNFAGRLEYDK